MSNETYRDLQIAIIVALALLIGVTMIRQSIDSAQPQPEVRDLPEEVQPSYAF